MADNVPIVPGTGATQTVATLDVGGGVEVQRVLPQARAGASAIDVTASSPLPVSATMAGIATVTLGNPPTNPSATVAIGTVVLPAVGGTVSLAGGTVTLSNPAAAPLATVAVGTIVLPAIGGTVSIAGGTLSSVNAGGTVSIGARPYSDATTDSIAAKLDTDTIHRGATPLTPKFANINAAASGNNTLVASVSGKKIRALSLTTVAKVAVDVTLQDGSGTMVGPIPCATYGGVVLPFSPVGWFETSSSRPLQMNLTASGMNGGCITYVEI